MYNQDNKPDQTANQSTLLTLKETLSLDWQRIVDASKNDKTHVERVFQEFIHSVESNHREQRSPKFYAEKLNMTKSNLRKICQLVIGASSKYCIHTRLMLEACTKLKETNPIKEIAFELGFEDPKHFSKFFKKQCGLSPDVYRKIIFKRP